MANDVQILGLSELMRTLEKLPKEIASKSGGPVKQALFQAAKLIREDASRRAPMGKTGNLKRAVRMRRYRNPKSRGYSEAYIIDVRTGKKPKKGQKARPNQAYYWRWVEFGSKKQKAQPFLRPAFEANKEAAVRKFQEVFRRKIDLAVRKAKQ